MPRRLGTCDATEPCNSTPTHQWLEFRCCTRHALQYNRDNGTSYVPISDTEAVLVPVEHSEDVWDAECTECGAKVHRCNYHYFAGCRARNQHMTRCTLCQSCVRNLYHEHCANCYRVVNNGWRCEDCSYGVECGCVSRSPYNSDVCRNCYEASSELDDDNDNNDLIKNYHEYELPKARPVMRDSMHNGKPFLYLGVELECEMERGSDRFVAAEAINAVHAADVVMAYDSSLDSGFETITGPMSLDEHMKLWPKLAPLMAKNGCRSWLPKSTGMHVHVSRNFFSQLQVGKMLVFLNSDKTNEQITKLAGRTSEHYAKLSPKKLTDVYQNYERYNGLNLTNERTLEFRIFKGTLKTGHILANIEFCHALSMYVQNASTRVMEDWPRFMEWVLKQGPIYRNLTSFFEPNNIHEVAA